MKTSRRSRRIERRNKLMRQPMFNLVSLMDIFTILVFFLLVNSSNTQQLPKKKDVTLPSSFASKAPEETLKLIVTTKDVLVDGRVVVSVADILQYEGEYIEALVDELAFQAGKNPNAGIAEPGGSALTILADENLPYGLVDKILKTCQHANYRKIAFAVMQIAKKES